MIVRLIKTPFIVAAQAVRSVVSIVATVVKTLAAICKFVFVKGFFIAIIGAIGYLIGKKHTDNKKS
jgi:hypothetical protein